MGDEQGKNDLAYQQTMNTPPRNVAAAAAAAPDNQAQMEDDAGQMDASEAESIRIARVDFRDKMANNSVATPTRTPSSGPPGAVAMEGNSRHGTPLRPAGLSSFNSGASGGDRGAESVRSENNDPAPSELELVPIVARLVDDVDDDEEGADNVNNSVHAGLECSPDKVLVPAKAEKLIFGVFSMHQIWVLGIFIAAFSVIVVVVAVVFSTRGSNAADPTFPTTQSHSLAPTETPGSTLEQIRKRDKLRCGIWKQSLQFFSMAKIYDSPEDQVDYLLVSRRINQAVFTSAETER